MFMVEISSIYLVTPHECNKTIKKLIFNKKGHKNQENHEIMSEVIEIRKFQHFPNFSNHECLNSIKFEDLNVFLAFTDVK